MPPVMIGPKGHSVARVTSWLGMYKPNLITKKHWEKKTLLNEKNST